MLAGERASRGIYDGCRESMEKERCLLEGEHREAEICIVWRESVEKEIMPGESMEMEIYWVKREHG